MSENTHELELFGSKKQPDHEIAWKFYQKGVDFKRGLNLYDCVKVNENFFIGKQWEGVQANGLPTPTFNIIKRVVSFITATITSDNIKVTATPMANAIDTGFLDEMTNIVNHELAYLFERNAVPSLTRRFTRNAAVDGDGCTYTYWDPNAETGQEAKGAIVTEVVENRRVHFGDPNDNQVQSQPWIIIEKRETVRKVRRRAKANGIGTWSEIGADDEVDGVDDVKRVDDKCTVLLLLWKDEDTGEVWAYESCKDSPVMEPKNLGIKLYPITWLNWDYVQDSYHGQAMVTSLIPNQVFINKAWAMSMLSIMRTAYPKYVYNKSLIPKMDNRIGSAIGIAGGDMNNVIKVIDPPTISPQVSQFLQLAVEESEQSLGATSVALGDTRPDNTSAIIALQRAAATPSEMTKQNLYNATEDLARIYFEFMGEYYGTRYVMVPPSEKEREAAQFAGVQLPTRIPKEFDFNQLKLHPMLLKLDVGASTYYSEIAAMQTLDGLLQRGLITLSQYLERVSDDYVPKRRELLEEAKAKEAMEQQMLMGQAAAPEGAALPTPDFSGTPEIPTGGGYSALQRKINETGSTAGLI